MAVLPFRIWLWLPHQSPYKPKPAKNRGWFLWTTKDILSKRLRCQIFDEVLQKPQRGTPGSRQRARGHQSGASTSSGIRLTSHRYCFPRLFGWGMLQFIETNRSSSWYRYVLCPLDVAAALPLATSTPVTNLRQYYNSDLGYNDLKF